MSHLDDTRESALRDAMHLVWRNLPGQPSTFSACVNAADGQLHTAGRGGGPCLECATRRLASLVGEELADLYVCEVREVRATETAMQEMLA